ncbi:MAG: precorrin-8X methylmutase [Nitrospirae bacterium]|nr:precorrin-8X methylmutase [Nitrospirota bacterium]
MKRRFDSLHLPVVKRVIHATGDFDFEDILRFHPEAITSGIAAIRAGKDIFADVKMVEAGINKKALAQFGGRVVCYISDEDVVARAAEDKALTRAECAVEKAFLMKNNEINIGIAAIGNAPTALARLMDIIEDGVVNPGLIVGVPVGFVKAEESKADLANKSYPYITCAGKKGGSPIAAAIINAIIKLAGKETP